MKTLASALLSLALFAALWTLPVAPARAQAWQRYQPSERFFSVLLPKTPEAKSAPVPANQAVMEYDYLADMGATAYQVTVLVFGPGSTVPTPTDDYWTRVIQGYAKGSGSVLSTQRPVTFAGQRGVEALTDDNANNLHHRIDAVLVGNRLFLVVAAGPNEFPTSHDALRFFDSFRVLQ